MLNAKGDIAKETKTDNNGNYIFADIENGEYNVVFKYNTNQYRITKYKVSRVSESANSNATKQEVVINGEKITAGVTEQITLNKDIENINLGLIENKKFDFKVDNYISKITVKTKNGTTEIPYSNANLAKAEINAKEIEGAVVTVEYKIVVTNNGEINGTVGRIIDYIPEGVNLTQDMTSEWINNNDGSYVNNSLANKIIKPGKSEEITLKITRELTENSTGLYKNSVKIDSIKNQLEIEELSLQNNTSNADFIISISTGALTYILFVVLIISIIVIVLNYKFNIINKFKISILTIIGSIFIVIIMQVSYPSKAADIDWSKYSETRHIYLTAAHISQGDRLRDIKETLTGIIYSDSHKVNLHTNWYLKFFGSDLYEIPAPTLGKGTGNVIEYNMDTSDIYQLINNYNFDKGASISRSENVVFFNHDWRAFFELDDDAGERIYYQDGEYYLDGTPRYFGRCIDETKDGGPFAINIANLGWDAEILVKNNVYDYNVNAYYPIYATWTCTGNWWDLYYDGDGEYGYFVENETPTPEFNITGNGNETIRIKDFDDSNYLIGPFSITRNDQNTDYTFEIVGSNGNIGQSDFLTCDDNGNYKRVKGRCPKFYLKVNKNRIKNINRILKVELTTEDVEYTYDCDITAVGKKIYSCPGYQEVAGDTPYIPFEPEQRKIHSNYEWNNFQGALTIHKNDEQSWQKDNNTYVRTPDGETTMEGIYFVLYRQGYGWVEENSDGTFAYNPNWNESKAVKLRTDSRGDTRTLVGLDSGYNGENGKGGYMAFEIIKALDGGNSTYNLPGKLSDLYKATHPNGERGCPYSLKLIEKIDGYDNYYAGISSGEFRNATLTNTRDYVTLKIQKQDEIGKDENGNNLNLAGISFKVYKKGAGWVQKENTSDVHSNIRYVDFNNATPIETKSDGSTDLLRRLDNDGEYIICETFIPARLADYYCTKSYNGGDAIIQKFCTDYGIPHDKGIKLVADQNGKLITECKKIKIWESPSQGDGFEHGVYYWNAKNNRDFVALTVQKKDKNTSNIDLSGLRFKVYKCNEFDSTGHSILKEGEYGWVQKIQPNYDHSYVRYVEGMDGFNNAFEIVVDKNGNWTDANGKVQTLKRLTNNGTYMVFETYIPEQLQDDYKLNYGETGTGGIDLGRTINGGRPFNGGIKFLVDDNGQKISPQTIKANKDNLGAFYWKGKNLKDYFSLQLKKIDKNNKVVPGIGFAVKEITYKSDGTIKAENWVIIKSDGTYGTEPSLEKAVKRLHGKFVTDSTGYTEIIRKIPIKYRGGSTNVNTPYVSYEIYEIDIGEYGDVYRLSTFKITKEGTKDVNITAPGHRVGKFIVDDNFVNKNEVNINAEEFKVQTANGETINSYNNFYLKSLEKNRQRNNSGHKLHSVFVIQHENPQYYGAIKLRKVDQLTGVPLGNIGVRIRTQSGQWLIINNKKSGVIEANDTSKKEVTGTTNNILEATEIRTNAQGYTDTIYKVPIYQNKVARYTYLAYETYIPSELRNYYALNSNFTKYAPSNCTTAQYKSLETAAIYELNGTTLRNYLNNINNIRNSLGASQIDETTFLKDVVKLVAHDVLVSEIDKNDNRKPVITQFEAVNEQDYISVSGYVWEDGLQGKNITNRDSKRRIAGSYIGMDLESLDYNIQNIKVALMKRITFNGKSAELTIATTDTDVNGKYSFSKLKIKDLANYYIKFTYDGITYQATDVDLNSTGLQTVTGSPTFASTPSSETSKATEIVQQRNTLNQAFKELNGDRQLLTEGKYNGVTLNYKKVTDYIGSAPVYNVCLSNTYAGNWKRPDTLHPRAVEINNNSSIKYDFLIESTIDKGTINNENQSILLYYYNLMAYNTKASERITGYKDNKATRLTEIPYLNLGLYKREQPNLTLQKDIYKADLSINDTKYTYMYNQKLKTAETQKVSTAVDFDGDYSLPIYEADVYYGDTNKDSVSVASGKQLQATITYKIKLQNASANLYTKINQIKEYFPEAFTIDSARVNGKMYALIYIMNTNTPTNADFTNKNNLVGIDAINNSYQTVTGSDGKVYKKYTINLGNKGTLGIDKDTNTKYLYIQFKIDNDKLKTYYTDLAEKEEQEEAVSKIVSEFVNYADISSYSVYSNTKMEPYAHVDSTSIPNSLEKNGLTINEDDEDNAPGLKIVKPGQRNITGLVFKDAPVKFDDKNKNGSRDADEKIYDTNDNGKIDPGEERVGNGYAHGQSGADIGNDDMLANVKVKLLGSDGKYAQFWDEKEHKWKDETFIRTGSTGSEKGKFDLLGFVPGEYRVEFVWGIDSGIDVSRYKCTILSNPNIINKDTVQYDGEIEYKAGYNWLTEGTQYSDAKDDYIRRLAIDKLNLKVDDSAYDGLTASDGTSLLDKVNDYITKFGTDGEDDNSLKYMHSTTPQFSVGVERNGGKTGITTDAQSKEMMINTFSGFDYKINKVDFGIIERPKRAMSVQKHIKSIKITTPEGRPVVIATIGKDEKINAIAGEKYISGGYKLGYLYAQIDKNLQQSMKVEVEYEVEVSGLSELDYDYVGYYLYAIPKDGTELKLKATNLYDYVGGATITTDSKDEDRWQSAELTDEYLKVPTVGEINNATATEKLIMDIFKYAPEHAPIGGTSYFGKQTNKEKVLNIIDEMGIYNDIDTLNDKVTAKEAKETLANIYTKLMNDWDNSEYKNETELTVKRIRSLKLKNREVVQGDPNTNTLVKDYYGSTETRVGKIKISKIISNGEDIDLNNDIEIASVAVDTTQKTGANADPTYAPLYDRAEYVTVSPAQGEDKGYVGKAIVGIGILTVLASGIILIKRYVSSK